jgi:hypothetical protein
MNLVYRYSSVGIKTLPNDVLIRIKSYLVDNDGIPFTTSDTNEVDYFNVDVYKSIKPVPMISSYLVTQFLLILNDTYSFTKAAQIRSGSDIAVSIDDTSKLVPGLSVYGDGIQTDTTIKAIRDAVSLKLDKVATITGSTSFLFNTKMWNIDYSALDTLLAQINFDTI